MEGAYVYVPTTAEQRADEAMLIWYYLKRFQHLSVAMRFLLAEAFFGRGPPRSPSGTAQGLDGRSGRHRLSV